MDEDIKEKLWGGVELKLENARFHFEKMGQSLEPPENTHMNVVQQSAGAIIDTRLAALILCAFGCVSLDGPKHCRYHQLLLWPRYRSADEKLVQQPIP